MTKINTVANNGLTIVENYALQSPLWQEPETGGR